MLNFLRKHFGVNLFFSYKLTALVTIMVSVVNIYYWVTDDFYNVFSGFTINPNATMKVITSIGFLILGSIYYLKKTNLIKGLIFLGLLIQVIQFSIANLSILENDFNNLSSGATILMFCIAYSSMYFIKVKKLKIVFLILNSTLYILSSFAVFYYLLDMDELNTISGFETLSWNTAMIFFMNSISLFELKLINKIDPIKFNEVVSKKTHPYNYFPYFFLIPVLFIIFASFAAYYKIITIVQAAFFIILFLNTSSFINMFFYSYNFILFYVEITRKSSQLKANNKLLNSLNEELTSLNKKLKRKNAYLEDFASITSHNLREPIIALEELQKISEQIASQEGFTNEEVQTMFNTSISRLHQGINSLVQYHDFIKNEDQKSDNKISLKTGIESIINNTKNLAPANTLIDLDIKQDLTIQKNYIDTIFSNLLSNSYKYKKNSTNLKVKIIAYRVNDTYSILYRDNGVGINLSYFKKHLFKKRKRFHKKSNNSNGYGLYYTKLCVKKLNGKIDIYSTLGKGTAFRIKLKLPLNNE
ncbi:ATP-binding protein [Winogradskyella sp.]|uniref:ATP-binding protein n=1 Tax=Winogradskyella sp. TaxID=1883156 RepID=UPI003AA9335C